MMEIGRDGGDRKLNPTLQVLSCQRRSTAAFFQWVSNGVKFRSRSQPKLYCRKKQTRLVQSHFEVFFERLSKARMSPPVSDGEMVFSSTKITPPCFRSSSAQTLSSGGIVLRSYVTSVNP